MHGMKLSFINQFQAQLKHMVAMAPHLDIGHQKTCFSLKYNYTLHEWYQ